MSGVDQQLVRVNTKIQQLLKQYSLLQKENQKLKAELSDARSLLKQKDEQVEMTMLRLEVLKASKGEMTDEEKKSFQKKINQYLKEIEKCIAFLNE